MPMDMSKYPENWKKVSHEIRFVRAKGLCEWCGVKHRAVGARDKSGKWWDKSNIDNLQSDMGYFYFDCDYPKLIRIIITTAHLGTPYADGSPCPKTNTMDVRPENLAALCQRCHLKFDTDQRLETAYLTRMKKRLFVGNRLLGKTFESIIFGS